MIDLTDEQIKADIMDRLLRRHCWGEKYLPIDSLANWMGKQIKRDGKRVRKLLDDLVKEGFLFLYKRNIGMNDPMSVDEIKNAILNSRKTEQSLYQLMYEAGTIRRKLILARKEFLEHRDIEFAVKQCEFIPTNSLSFFLYNQSYLYENDLHVSITRVIEEIVKLKTYTLVLYEAAKTSTEDEVYRNKLKEMGFSSAEDFVIHECVSRIDIALNELEKFEKYTNKEIIDAIYSEEPLPEGY